MEKMLIVFATRHGTCRKVAEIIQSSLPERSIDLLELPASEKINFDHYNDIIIGGSIHGGKIQDRIKKFCIENLEILLNKKIGLFLCSMKEHETALMQYKRAFPEELIKHAEINSLCGGEFLFDKMHLFERKIVKKFSGATNTVSNIDHKALSEFSEVFSLN